MARTSGRRRRNGDGPRREWGTVLDVRRTYTSRRLAADAAAGAVSVPVKSGSIFEGSGSVELNDQVVAYTSWDPTTGALALAEPLAAAAVEGDQVFLYLPRRQTRAVDFEADVEIDGWDGEPLPALLAPGLDRELPPGPRGPGEGEEVLVEYDEAEDEWYVIRSRGLADVTGPKYEGRDPHTLTAGEITAGTFTHQLLHDRIVTDRALRPLVNGVELGPDRYVVDAEVGAVTVTLAGWETVEEDVWFDYWYLNGPARSAEPFVAVAFETSGWRYLVVSEVDSVDRSAPGFDDSGWAVGTAAFGHPGGTPPEFVAAGLPERTTDVGATNLGFWLRREVSIPPSVGAVSITVKADGKWWLYFNGALVGSGEAVLTTPPFIVSAPTGSVTIALRVQDDSSDPPGGDWIYGDVEIVEAP